MIGGLCEKEYGRWTPSALPLSRFGRRDYSNNGCFWVMRLWIFLNIPAVPDVVVQHFAV